MRRCVKKTLARRKGRYIDPTGVRVNVERFNWLRTPYTRLHEFGCPIAVTLYLEFLLKGSVLFLLMAVIAAPSAIDAVMRNARRKECRTLVHAADLSVEQAASLLGCGYSGIDVRASLPDTVSAYNIWWMPAFGTCMEYAADPPSCYLPLANEDSLSYCNITSLQVIATRSFTPFTALNSSSPPDFCADVHPNRGVSNERLASCTLHPAPCTLRSIKRAPRLLPHAALPRLLYLMAPVLQPL